MEEFDQFVTQVQDYKLETEEERLIFGLGFFEIKLPIIVLYRKIFFYKTYLK